LRINSVPKIKWFLADAFPWLLSQAQNRIKIHYQSWDFSFRDMTLKRHWSKVDCLLNQHLLLGTIVNEVEANHRPKHEDRYGHWHTRHETQHAQEARAAEKDFCTLSNRESPPPDPFHSSNKIFSNRFGLKNMLESESKIQANH
jgi:hypothetical protein